MMVNDDKVCANYMAIISNTTIMTVLQLLQMMTVFGIRLISVSQPGTVEARA
ncbi:hypothetical protein DPMN_021991 [Dreissena polymorpha]|uniref:Uncharacterized protein n=1 Tax=Dreissena polymorpha TaxID=45954 RepID=A0A9D4SBG7_DREPO|nr:hypothetical protein DPMN_021991 [Dreissena polymorpha]